MKQTFEIINSVFENPWTKSVIILIIAYILDKLLTSKLLSSINGRFRKIHDEMRSETLYRILRKIISFIIYFLAILTIAELLFNINPASLIAATGVVGVGIGLASQSLIKDAINGFLILFENQYSVNELVTINDFTGTVNELTLRATKLVSMTGDLFIIPNSSISTVINHSRFTRGILISVGVSYNTDLDFAISVFSKMSERAKEEIPELTEIPAVLGVTDLADSGIIIRLLAKCEPGSQFTIERELLKRIRCTCDENNIDIPYNHLVVINKDERN